MKNLLAYLGIDRSVAYTLAGRSWGLLSGIITLLLVARYLTPDEQGYYFTFASILAMQTLFELGMSVVVTQFSSHEMAHLTWHETGTLEGDARVKGRLRSLLLLVTKWYGVIAVLIIVVVLPVGWMFFSVNDTQLTVNWKVVWIWLVLASVANIFFMPFLALLEGCGRVTEVALIRMKQNMIGSFFAWSVLMWGGSLLALPAMHTGMVLTILIWLWCTKKLFILRLLTQPVSAVAVNWKTEIWPFQWRIALSWLSGYFIFQLFTPILFIYRGSVEAGQMGMSISIANTLMGITISWMNAKSPKFGSLVAKRDYINLDRIFILTLSRSLAVMVFFGCGLGAINFIIHAKNINFAYRILDPLPFLLLVLATIFAYVTYAQATYLRAHKEEPFMVIGLISAALIGGSAVVLGKKYGAMGLMVSHAAVYGIVGVGWGSKIFFSKRREWQRNGATEVP